MCEITTNSTPPIWTRRSATRPTTPPPLSAPQRTASSIPLALATTTARSSIASSGRATTPSHQTSQVETADLQVDGSLLHLPGGSFKLAAGGQFRHESFSAGGSIFYYGDTPTPQEAIDVGRSVAAGYLELNVPIFGPDNASPGFQRLSVSMAGRVENYSDVGTTANPKVGLIWAPVSDLSFHASYGTSFRATGGGCWKSMRSPPTTPPSFRKGQRTDPQPRALRGQHNLEARDGGQLERRRCL